MMFLMTALALILAGEKPKPFPPAACGIVPKARVEAALGRALGAGSEEFTRQESSCTYSGGDVGVSITIRQLTEPLDLPAELEQLRAAFPGSRLRELEWMKVEGMKPRAFALEIPGVGTQLHLLPGSRDYVLVSVMGLADSRRAFEAAVAIARAALEQ